MKPNPQKEEFVLTEKIRRANRGAQVDEKTKDERRKALRELTRLSEEAEGGYC